MAKQSFSVGQVLTANQMLSLQQTAMLGGSATAKTASYTLVAADAGTVVSVNSTSATTITVNTGLFSAGDTVTIQNWGSGLVTITAGTATVNTAGSLIVPQYDGGVLYFTSTSAAIYFDFVQAGAVSPLTTKGDLYTFGSSDTRIGVGANDTVLTADSSTATGLKWAAPASGGMTLLSTTTLSGSATTVSGISSAYNNLAIIIDSATTDTSPSGLRMTVNSLTTSIYGMVGVDRDATSFNQVLVHSAAFWLISGNTGLRSSDTDMLCQIIMPDYANTSTRKIGILNMYYIGNGNALQSKTANMDIATDTAISSFTLTLTSGNFNAGTVKVYGVK
jgi:hypothetical protein